MLGEMFLDVAHNHASNQSKIWLRERMENPQIKQRISSCEVRVGDYPIRTPEIAIADYRLKFYTASLAHLSSSITRNRKQAELSMLKESFLADPDIYSFGHLIPFSQDMQNPQMVLEGVKALMGASPSPIRSIFDIADMSEVDLQARIGAFKALIPNPSAQFTTIRQLSWAMYFLGRAQVDVARAFNSDAI
jgi:hypothetical protein